MSTYVYPSELTNEDILIIAQRAGDLTGVYVMWEYDTPIGRVLTESRDGELPKLVDGAREYLRESDPIKTSFLDSLRASAGAK